MPGRLSLTAPSSPSPAGNSDLPIEDLQRLDERRAEPGLTVRCLRNPDAGWFVAGTPTRPRSSAAMRYVRVAGLHLAGVRYGIRALRHHVITGLGRGPG